MNLELEKALDTVDNIKEQLSDWEYKNLMDILMASHKTTLESAISDRQISMSETASLQVLHGTLPPPPPPPPPPLPRHTQHIWRVHGIKVHFFSQVMYDGQDTAVESARHPTHIYHKRSYPLLGRDVSADYFCVGSGTWVRSNLVVRPLFDRHKIDYGTVKTFLGLTTEVERLQMIDVLHRTVPQRTKIKLKPTLRTRRLLAS